MFQGLEVMQNLQVLLLSFNDIVKMEGLAELTNLIHLDLSYNSIRRIEGIKVPPPPSPNYGPNISFQNVVHEWDNLVKRSWKFSTIKVPRTLNPP